jgi:hypothetical protein
MFSQKNQASGLPTLVGTSSRPIVDLQFSFLDFGSAAKGTARGQAENRAVFSIVDVATAGPISSHLYRQMWKVDVHGVHSISLRGSRHSSVNIPQFKLFAQNQSLQLHLAVSGGRNASLQQRPSSIKTTLAAPQPRSP